MDEKILIYAVTILVVSTILTGSFTVSSGIPPILPIGDYTYTSAPIVSQFNGGVLAPFKALSIFEGGGRGRTTTGSGYINFYGTNSWVATRINSTQVRINMTFIFKMKSSSKVIVEGWNKYENTSGLTAMLYFHDDGLWISNGTTFNYLTAFDVNNHIVNVVNLVVDYNLGIIEYIRLNGVDFEYASYTLPLTMGFEPCGGEEEFWQMQIGLWDGLGSYTNVDVYNMNMEVL